MMNDKSRNDMQFVGYMFRTEPPNFSNEIETSNRKGRVQ